MKLMNDTISRERAIKDVCFMLSDCFDADEELLDAVETTLNEISPVTHKPCDKCLHNHTSICGNCKDYDEYEPCNDTISRSGAIKAIEKKAKQIKNEDTLNGLAGAVEILFELPSTTPESGKWKREEFPNSKVVWFCTKCGRGNYYKPNYCPNCGNNAGILDKIRAEIEQNAYPIVHGVNNHEKGMTLYGILQVIDKYKAESEE